MNCGIRLLGPSGLQIQLLPHFGVCNATLLFLRNEEKGKCVQLINGKCYLKQTLNVWILKGVEALYAKGRYTNDNLGNM